MSGSDARPTTPGLDPGNRLIAALDVPDRVAAGALLTALGGVPSFIKIGLELYLAEGAQLVRELSAAGQRVMLDLKLHDIPATVARSVERVAELGAELLTVHCAGGPEMLEQARRAAGSRLRLLGVTVLTSMDQRAANSVGIGAPIAEVVLARARMAEEAGLWGVVASPQEAAAIRAGCPRLGIVTPGIRPAGRAAGDRDDQRRVATPAQARRAGADLIVVGRPIRDAADPAAAARAIVRELST